VTHVAEPADRGPFLERLLDHLDPVFEGDLPDNAYVWGPRVRASRPCCQRCLPPGPARPRGRRHPDDHTLTARLDAVVRLPGPPGGRQRVRALPRPAGRTGRGPGPEHGVGTEGRSAVDWGSNHRPAGGRGPRPRRRTGDAGPSDDTRRAGTVRRTPVDLRGSRPARPPRVGRVRRDGTRGASLSPAGASSTSSWTGPRRGWPPGCSATIRREKSQSGPTGTPNDALAALFAAADAAAAAGRDRIEPADVSTGIADVPRPSVSARSGAGVTRQPPVRPA